ncbi:MAG: hypothetical protein ACREM1_12965 [Longimicrobiales bacterium]
MTASPARDRGALSLNDEEVMIYVVPDQPDPAPKGTKMPKEPGTRHQEADSRTPHQERRR